MNRLGLGTNTLVSGEENLSFCQNNSFWSQKTNKLGITPRSPLKYLVVSHLHLQTQELLART